MLRKIGEERAILQMICKRKMNCLGHYIKRGCLILSVIERMMDGEKKRGKGRKKFPVDR